MAKKRGRRLHGIHHPKRWMKSLGHITDSEVDKMEHAFIEVAQYCNSNYGGGSDKWAGCHTGALKFYNKLRAAGFRH